jgi:DNA-binding NarL/FixJ family response regulator
VSIKVLVADDSAILRHAIRNVLSTQPEIELVGEAASFAQAIQMANALTPHVIVMDLHMPDENRIDPLDVKSQLNRGARTLGISMWNDEETQVLAQRLGAVTLLDKTELASTLIPAIVQLRGNSTGRAKAMIRKAGALIDRFVKRTSPN